MECSTTELRQHARGPDRIGQEALNGAPILATSPQAAQALGRRQKPAANPRLAIAFCFNWAVAARRFPLRSPCLARRSCLFSWQCSFKHSNRSTTMDEKHEDKGPGSVSTKDSRRDRLKLALRENLKRRKAQAKQRSGAASSEGEAASHDFGAKRPDK